MKSPLSFNSTRGFRSKLLTKNLPPYNSDGFSTDSKPDNREFSITNISVVDSKEVGVLGKEQGSLLYVRNLYGPEGGYGDIVNIKNLTNKLSNKESYYKFIFSKYSPFLILISDDPTGDNGLLSQDSNLAQIAAKSLRDEFEYRVSQETYQQTIGRVNAVDALSDPFDMLGIITGNKSVIERDWHISVPESLIGKGLDFISRVSGVFSPYSWISGEYFTSPVKKSSEQQAASDDGNFKKRGIKESVSGSEIFIASTGGGQKSRLFKNLRYNAYRPNYKSNFLDKLTMSAPEGNYYIGSDTEKPSDILFKESELPLDEFGNKIQSPVRGYGELAERYEKSDNSGDDVTKAKFGLGDVATYDEGDLAGGFTWVSPKYKDSAAEYVGKGGETMGVSNANFTSHEFINTESDNFDFKKGSILDDTQKLIEAADELGGDIKLQHVGNAIDQISKVFNDGTRELTKGSRVFSYVDENNDIVGKEYCRVFTKDIPYSTMSSLQKTEGITNENRRFSYSVLDKSYNLNIAPYRGDSSTNINKKLNKENVKKYMFSLENLAWRTSKKPGFTTQDLPLCERGPNGGRIMWFPPYDIKVSENNSVNWTENTFLGRPEPIYTYNNTSRVGSLSWKIVVDHPSILNAIVDKELKGKNNKKINGIVDSFFAGCRKYDIYELATRFPQFTYSDLYNMVEGEINLKTKEEYEEIKKEILIEEPTPITPIEPEIITIEENEELNLYFRNDYPNPKTTQITTDDIYDNLLVEYINKKGEYVALAQNEGVAVDNFFTRNIENTLTNFEGINKKIANALDNGGHVNIELIGSASSPATEAYNEKLSTRRIESIVNYLSLVNGGGDKTFDKYIIDGKISITEQIKGEELSVVNELGQTIDCTEDLPSPKNVSSIAAISCRKVKMIVKMTYNETLYDGENKEEILTEPTTGNITDSNTVQTPIYEKISTSSLEPKKDLAKIVVKKLLTECDYFEMMQEDSPMAYNGIKEKIKYFQPVFHSTTPEGLNSRLTFLQQCIRPGDTIPVINEDGTIKSGEATNTSFGAPPICILRIGDFYHTKIAINQISINYEPLIFDLNPEGIGVQPMLADITMSFYFIGGQGLKEPVAKLQNALSFNFYGNTEVYDERADVTENRDDINKKILEDIQNTTEFGVNNRTGQETGNDAAGTIGTISGTTIVSGTPETISGYTSYKMVMNNLIDTSQDYVNTVIKGLENISSYYGVGGLRLFNDNRNYITGNMINYFDGALLSQPLNLYGKSDKVGENIEDLFTKSQIDLTNETIPLMENISDKKFRNRDIKIYKRNIENKINDIKNKGMSDYGIGTYESLMKTTLLKITEVEENLIRVIDKLNFVLTSSDGRRIKSGRNILYSISPTTYVDTSSIPAPGDTYFEITDDIATIGGDLNDFYTKLDDNDIVVTLVPTNMFNTYYDFDVMNSSINTPEKVRCYMVFNDMVVNHLEILIEDLTNGITDQTLKNNYLRPLLLKLKGQYLESNNSIAGKFRTIKNDTTIRKFTENIYYTEVSRDKVRLFTYIKDNSVDATKNNDYNMLYSETNSNNDKQIFNGKIRL